MTEIVKIDCGEFNRQTGFEEACFPDGSPEKYAHTSCVNDRFTAVGGQNNRFCPYCRRDIPGGPAFAFWSGYFDGTVQWKVGPIYVCAKCGIDIVGEGSIDEAQRVLGWPVPGAFEAR